MRKVEADVKSVLGMCLNPRVLAGIGVAIVAIWVFAPQFLLAALPLLLLAVCPISMGLMAWTTRGQTSGHTTMAGQPAAVDLEARPPAEPQRQHAEG